MMDKRTWSKISWLESQDVVARSYERLHKRSLSTQRAMQVTSATRQAREYFLNASNSDTSVRPLLTFYGVSSLSRACLLLLGKHGGEQDLKSGHGLKTVGWRNVFSGDLSKALGSIGELKVQTCDGLYLDLVTHTENYMCVHVNSSAVGWGLKYPTVVSGAEIDFDELVARLPDLQDELTTLGKTAKFYRVSSLKFDQENGLRASLTSRENCSGIESYSQRGYEVECGGNGSIGLKAPVDVVNTHPPQLVHSYVNARFNLIPDLHLAEALWSGCSEICMTFKLSFFLGMLSRYFPTHWMAFVNGAKGDRYRSLLLQAQSVVEFSYPVLISELLEYRLKDV